MLLERRGGWKIVGARCFWASLSLMLLAACHRNGGYEAETFLAGKLSADERLASGLDRPLDLRFDADGRMLVVEQGGTARWIEDGAPLAPALVDLRDRIYAEGKRGLLGLALHPDFATNGRVFLKYNPIDALEPGHRVVLARFERAAGAASVDPSSEMRFIALDKITEIHDGGAPVFGPDGRLYVTFGDGGPHEDPVHAQDPATLLGALIRVDVPADEAAAEAAGDIRPFLAGPPEILAIGLRNPWRMSFDRQSEALYIADVGYETREELSVLSSDALAAAAEAPLNLGWPCFEGTAAYLVDGRCSGRTLTGPVLEYGHDQGFAITGGFVYRGSEMPALYGRYLYGDFVNGRIWSIDAQALDADLPGPDTRGAETPSSDTLNSEPGPDSPDSTAPDGEASTSGRIAEDSDSTALRAHAGARLELESGLSISGFGQDPAGELYLISYADGTVRRLRWKRP